MGFLTSLIVRRPRIVVAVCVIATLLAASGTLRLSSRNNYDANLPTDDPVVAGQARFEAVFGDDQTMLVAVESSDLTSTETLLKLREISDALTAIPGVAQGRVIGLATLPAGPGEPPLIDVIESLPPAERQSVLAAIPAMERLLSSDGNTTLISVDVSRSASQGAVASAVESITATFSGPERIYVVGDHTVAQAIDEGIESDLSLLLPVACLLILVAMRVCFRSTRDAFLTLGVMIGSIVWVLGLMGHLDVPLNVVTSTLPILLVAIASSYGIHVLRHARTHKGTREERVLCLLNEMRRPVMLTGLTSAIGTLSLLLFDVNSIREFGLFASLGILAATGGSLLFLPAVLGCLPIQDRTDEQVRLQRFLARVGTAALRQRTVTFLLATGAVFVCVMGISRIEIGMDPVTMFPPDHPVRSATKVITEQFAGARYFEVMVDAGWNGGALSSETIEAVSAFHVAAENVPGVTAVSSAADVVKTLPTALRQSILSQARMIDADARYARITVMLADTDQAVQSRLHEQLRELADMTFRDDTEVTFGGPVLRWIAQNRYVSIGKVLSVLAASVCVIVFCSVAFRSLRVGILCAVPLLVSTIATFGVMGWAGIRLNIATAITTSIGLGIGVDFGIHFLSRLRRELALRSAEQAVSVTMATTGRAILYDVVSNILGFGVLVFSLFGPVRDFGWLISLTMVTSSVGALILIPAMARWIGRQVSVSKQAPRSRLLDTAA